MARPIDYSLVDHLEAYNLGKKLPNVEKYQAYAGTDIQAVVSVPSNGYMPDVGRSPIHVLGNIQTLSISSTRSISPVRIIGRASPVQYLKGARTVAGTLAFATLNESVFNRVYDVSRRESFSTADTSFIADQLPPFDIVLLACTEKGGVAARVIRQVSLMNYGTTYSISDFFCEETYSYVALDVTPLSASNMEEAKRKIVKFFYEKASIAANSLLQKLGQANSSLTRAYEAQFGLDGDASRNPFTR